MVKLPIYLDHNATTPCDPRVVEIMVPYFTEYFGNAASRSHSFGWQAEAAVDIARERVAALIGAETKEIVFTSGATESDNLALKGIADAYASKGNHIITAVTEHKAVLDTCKHLEKKGVEVTWLEVDRNGMIDLQKLESAIRPTTILIALMYANNEIGVIHPIAEISRIAKKHQVIFFSDATQAVGKIRVDVNRDGIDLMAFNAHKIYGPKGIGALYVRRKNPRVKLSSQMDGGGHERGFRSGTLNVPAIVGFGKACELCMQEMSLESEKLLRQRNNLENALLTIEQTYLNGDKDHRLPQLTNISFKYVNSESLMMSINKDIAVSSGSACTSASMEPSYVLKALGLDDELAHSSLRFGLGRYTSDEEIYYTVERIKEAVNRLRETNPVWEMFKEGKNVNV